MCKYSWHVICDVLAFTALILVIFLGTPFVIICSVFGAEMQHYNSLVRIDNCNITNTGTDYFKNDKLQYKYPISYTYNQVEIIDSVITSNAYNIGNIITCYHNKKYPNTGSQTYLQNEFPSALFISLLVFGSIVVPSCLFAAPYYIINRIINSYKRSVPSDTTNL